MNLLLKNNKTVAIYARLSREEMEEKSNSIDNQITFLNDYAKENEMFVYKEYRDNGYSGSNFDRPSFIEMINDIKAGKVNCVLIKDISRFARNVAGTGMYLEEFFPKYNVRLISVLDYYDSVTATEEDDGYLIMKSFLSDYYLRDIRKKFNVTLIYKANNGYIVFSAKYGYKKDLKGKIEIDGEVSDVVKMIFNLFKEGNRPKQICDILEEKKMLCPSYYRFLKTGKKMQKLPENPYRWSVSTVIQILFDYEYCGHAVNLTTKTVNKKQIKNKDYVIVKNTHPGIISEEDYAFVLKNYRKTVRENHSDEKLHNIYCGKCNKPIRARIDIASNYKYYRCKECNTKIKMDDLHEIVYKEVMHTIKQIRKDKEGYKEIVKRKLSQSRFGGIESLEKQKNNIDIQMQNLFEKKVLGDISESEYLNKIKELNKEKEIIDNKYKDIENIKEKLFNFEDRFKSFVQNMERKEKNKLDFIKLLVDKIIINDNKINIVYKYE